MAGKAGRRVRAGDTVRVIASGEIGKVVVDNEVKPLRFTVMFKGDAANTGDHSEEELELAPEPDSGESYMTPKDSLYCKHPVTAVWTCA
jgi:hypothetical protein